MEEADAKREILAEWKAWFPAHHGSARPTHKHAHDFYFRHLEPSRPQLLAFSTNSDKWNLVQSWLRTAGGVR